MKPTSKPLLILLCCICCHSLRAQMPVTQAPPPIQYNSSPTNNFPQTGTLPQQPAARLAANPTTQPSDPASLTSEGTAEEESSASIQVGSIVSAVREGGPLMFPILLCSTVLLVFVFERLLFLRKGRIIPRPFVRGVIEQLEQQQLQKEEALELCEENESLVADLFSVALKKW